MQDRKRVGMRLLGFVILILASVALPVTALPAAASEPTGTGPEDALTPSNAWKPVNPGESHWYAFYYKGDGSQIDVRLEVEPAGGAGFAIWTPEAIQRRGLGLEAQPVGRGATDPSAGNALVWSGNFNMEGTYYVVVEHEEGQPGTNYYLLKVSGDSVSYSAPAPPPAAAPEPANGQPKTTAPAAPKGRLAFQTAVGGDIYVVNVDGSGLRRVAAGIDPTWSPNGSEIAFVRWQEPRGVWVVDADSGNEWRAFDWNQARWPSWSPDGGRILFSRQHGGRTEEVEKCFWRWCFTLPPDPFWKLAIVRTVDGTLTEPQCSEYSRAPSWSPNGDRIVLDDELGLRVQNEDQSVSYLITDDPRDTSPVWSPGGNRVAFVRRQHDHWEIYAVDADGRNLTRLTDTPRKPNGQVGNSVSPAWSPDGNYIAFLTDRSGKWEIWVMRAGGGQQRPMFDEALDGLKLDYSYIGERAISWSR